MDQPAFNKHNAIFLISSLDVRRDQEVDPNQGI